MPTRNYLAVDLGATSGRTIVATYDGQKVEMRELTRLKNPMIPIAGHLFWDLPALYNEILAALRKTLPERHHHLIPKNEEAIRKGMEIIRKL